MEGEDAYGAFRDHIKQVFTYDDLVFPYGEKGFAIIQLNIDLDEGLQRVEQFLLDRIEKGGGRRTRSGLTSRNGRLISADRLISEAASALRKTTDDKTIVAFRSDPQKYREFLKKQS